MFGGPHRSDGVKRAQRRERGQSTKCPWEGGVVPPNQLVRLEFPILSLNPRLRQRCVALVHESKPTRGSPCREATHRPMRYDSGRPASVI